MRGSARRKQDQRKKEKNNKNNKNNRRKHAPDFMFFFTLLLIVCFGIVMVFSASYYFAMTAMNDQFHFAKKQGMIATLGIVLMLIITYKIDYHWLLNKKIVALGYFGSLGLVLFVLVSGVEKKGAQRWIDIGGISFQPSELVKLAVIVAVSAFIVNHQEQMHKAKYILTAWMMVFIPTILIAMENLSSAIVVAFVGSVIIFVSSKVTWYFPVVGGGVAAFGTYAYWLAMNTTPDQELGGLLGKVLKQYRLNRIRVWMNPWLDPQGGGYQPIQSLYAVGSGGLFGLGLGQGIQKLGFIPEPHNDIIFAVICEELGLVGASAIIIAFTVLVIRGLIIGIQAQDLFGVLLATGISSMVGIQVLINVAVNTNTIPTTGMQLPFISYGGTALLFALCGMGLLLNISRFSNVRKVHS